MTRASLVLGALLGVVSLVGGILGYARAGSVASLVAGGVSGLLLLACVVWGARGSTAARVLMSTLGLLLLGRFLPAYFRTYDVWPALVLVLLGTLTFGFGILGVLLDRYRPGPGRS
jgi:uncharacterized membrane protein (UPF0136 family)